MEVIKFLIGFIVIIAVIVIIVSNKMGKKKSPFLLFAIVDIVIGLLLLAFAIYDFTSVGEFAGIFGQLALIIGEPVVGGLLLIDIIVWVIYKKNKKKTSVTE